MCEHMYRTIWNGCTCNWLNSRKYTNYIFFHRFLSTWSMHIFNATYNCNKPGIETISVNNLDEIIDIFGVIGEDGNGTNWEYLDGRAVRKIDILNPNPVFSVNEWTIYSDAANSLISNPNSVQNAPQPLRQSPCGIHEVDGLLVCPTQSVDSAVYHHATGRPAKPTNPCIPGLI